MRPNRPEPISHLTGSRSDRPYPPGISLPGAGGKFDTAGGVQIWPGNTFVCHVTRSSASYAGLVELQEAVKRSDFARFFTFLPPPSFHMTVLQGYSPTPDIAQHLPQDLPDDLGPDAVAAEIRRRLAGHPMPQPRVAPRDLYCLHSLTLDGATDADETALRAARSALRDATGISRPDFDGYIFHVTLAYLIQWLSPAAAQEAVDFSAELSRDFCAAHPMIALDPCAFCTFDSMHHFEPVAL